jgi:hypothetical protein
MLDRYHPISIYGISKSKKSIIKVSGAFFGLLLHLLGDSGKPEILLVTAYGRLQEGI